MVVKVLFYVVCNDISMSLVMTFKFGHFDEIQNYPYVPGWKCPARAQRPGHCASGTKWKPGCSFRREVVLSVCFLTVDYSTTIYIYQL